MLYPAITWRHKNHIRLLTALAKVNQTSQLDLHLVCCGQYGPYLQEIMAQAEAVGIRDHVRFLGHIERREVRGLYRLAEFCIYPTLFEGAGFPVLEAFEAYNQAMLGASHESTGESLALAQQDLQGLIRLDAPDDSGQDS